jgi:hypothetical protein
VRRLLSTLVAACLERRSSALLQRALCYWIPLAIAGATIVLPKGAPVGFFAIPGALLAAASFSRPKATVAVITATAAIVTGPVVVLVRSGLTVVDVAGAGARILLVVGICALVGSLVDLLRRTHEAEEEVSRALDLHL